MSGITLYHFPPSGPSRGALLAVRALGLDVTVKEVNLFAKEQLDPEFLKRMGPSLLKAGQDHTLEANQNYTGMVLSRLKQDLSRNLNPQHCVPTLDDNGFVLWESRAIAQYLCQVYGGAKGPILCPQDPKKKALVDQRLYFDAGTLYPRIRAICFPVLYLGETTVSKDKKDSVAEAFGFLDTFLSGSSWVAGDHATIADCAVLASITGIVAAGLDITPYPNVVAWLARCQENLAGFDENQIGADIFGNAVKSKLDPGQL